MPSALLHPVVAVDGTAASGKSTFSRELARRLGYAYVNTGAMYRGVTWYMLDKQVPLDDGNAIALEIAKAEMATPLQGTEFIFHIAGIDPASHARDARVNEGVSLVAKVPEVRRLLVAAQQKLAAEAPLVMEGRDIGSVVFPETPYKFYVDADAAVRAQRRAHQGETDVVLKRDAIDSQRQTSPLLRVTDARYLDSTSTSIEEMVAIALRHLAARGMVVDGSSVS